MIATLLAPAKVNLGLEILGKRPDGYHEIRTILQAVSLYDDLEASPANATSLIIDDPRLDHSENLALRAANAWSDEIDPEHRHLSLKLTKRIPAAAGLGGASSNAAGVFLVANALYGIAPDAHRLHQVAGRLGSDVPFFLDGPTAVASGRGEALRPISPLAGCTLVLATPIVSIARKTLTMYRALTPDDYGSGEAVAAAAACLEQGRALAQHHLTNAFERPLLSMHPELESVPRIMRSLGADRVGLSGAGPTWYAIMDSEPDAAALASELHRRQSTVRVSVVRPLTERPVAMRIDDRNAGALSGV